MNKEYEALLTKLHRAMIAFDRDDPKRTQHFAKVHSYARLIAQLEGVDEETQFALETAAYAHDIGIHVAEEKLGYQNGKLQEELGPAAAEEIYESLGFPRGTIDRAMWLIAHHHTYADIDAVDYQILVEADFLVNIFEDEETYANRANDGMKAAALRVREAIFKTQSGISILNDMFGL